MDKTTSGMLEEAREAVVGSKNYAAAKEIAEMFGVDPAQLDQWRRDRAVFSFSHCGVDYFPTYAFDPQNAWAPYPAIAKIVAIFGSEKGGWGCAFWFEAVNGYLGGRTPREALAAEPDRVIQAAVLEIEPVSHA